MASKYFSISFSVILLTIFVSIAECACPQGFTDIEGGCYKYDETLAVNYEDAKSLCEEDSGSHLAYIPDCNTFAYLVSNLKARSHSTTTSGFWIGATDEEEESYWVWGNGYPVRMGVPFWGTSDNWDAEPNGGKGENCAQLSISDQYFMHDEDCQSEGVPLCQADSIETPKQVNNYQSVTCPQGFKYIGKSCFFFGNNVEVKTARDAFQYCEGNSSSLPVLKDCAEFQELVEEIENELQMEFQNQMEMTPNIAPFFIGMIDITSMMLIVAKEIEFCAKHLQLQTPCRMSSIKLEH
ncbi:Collectin-12 [Armadillidium vulgare]|nr:Collectin-12 [Armadillidium vulgare]